MAVEITDAQFAQEVEQNQGVVFVDFWAPWCGPCVMMSPIYDKVSKKYPQIKFCKVNTTDNAQKAGQYGIMSIPCIVIFKDGKEMERLIGFKPEPAFEQIVKRYIG